MRPDHQTVAPALPFVSSAGVRGPEVPVALLPAHGRRVEAGQQSGPRARRAGSARSRPPARGRGRRPARPPRGDVEGVPRLPGGPAGPPADVGLGAGPNASSQRRRSRPAPLAARRARAARGASMVVHRYWRLDPRAARPTADDPTLRGKEREDSRRGADLCLPARSDPEPHLLGEQRRLGSPRSRLSPRPSSARRAASDAWSIQEPGSSATPASARNLSSLRRSRAAITWVHAASTHGQGRAGRRRASVACRASARATGSS